MSAITGAAIYFIIWWVCLFIALPIGVKTQDEEGEVTLGTVSSAPVRPRIWFKLLLTTIMATIVFATLWGLQRAGFTLDDIPFLPRF